MISNRFREESSKPYSMPNPWMVLTVTSIGTLLATVNSSTINLAIPTIMEQLHAPITDVGWVTMSYMVTLTVCAIHAGKISDRFGRKVVYITGVSLFTLISIFAGFTNSIYWLIFARALLGVAGAAMIVNSAAMITDAFPPNQRGKALGTNGIAIASGAIFGPVIGGLLLEIGWRWIFWFNVPLGAFLVIWAGRILPSYRRHRSDQDHEQTFDMMGTVTLLFALIGILGVISYGTYSGWNSPIIYGLMITGIFGFVAFIWVENRAIDPIMQFDLFRNRTYAIANSNAFLNALSRMGVTFVLIVYLQLDRGYAPVEAGMYLVPMATAMLIVGPFSGRLSDRIGSRLPATAGLLMSALGILGLVAIDSNTSNLYLVTNLVIIGIGTGLFQSPNLVAIMNAAPAANRSVVAGTRMMLNNLGMLLSISLSTGLMGRVLPDPEALHHQATPGTPSYLLETVRVVFIGCAIVSFVAAALSWFRESVPQSSKESEIKKESVT
jgi:EmrB/QacA subfamily drug resistance transporter